MAAFAWVQRIEQKLCPPPPPPVPPWKQWPLSHSASLLHGPTALAFFPELPEVLPDVEPEVLPDDELVELVLDVVLPEVLPDELALDVVLPEEEPAVLSSSSSLHAMTRTALPIATAQTVIPSLEFGRIATSAIEASGAISRGSVTSPLTK